MVGSKVGGRGGVCVCVWGVNVKHGGPECQDGCEPRIELIVKVQKSRGGRGGGGRGEGSQGGCEPRLLVIVKMKKAGGGPAGGGGGWSGWW